MLSPSPLPLPLPSPSPPSTSSLSSSTLLCQRHVVIVVVIMLLGGQLEELDQTTPQRPRPWHADGAPTPILAMQGLAVLTQGHYVPDVLCCQLDAQRTTHVYNISQPDWIFEPNHFVLTFASGKRRSGQRRFYQFQSHAEHHVRCWMHQGGGGLSSRRRKSPIGNFGLATNFSLFF